MSSSLALNLITNQLHRFLWLLLWLIYTFFWINVKFHQIGVQLVPTLNNVKSSLQAVGRNWPERYFWRASTCSWAIIRQLTKDNQFIEPDQADISLWICPVRQNQTCFSYHSHLRWKGGHEKSCMLCCFSAASLNIDHQRRTHHRWGTLTWTQKHTWEELQRG